MKELPIIFSAPMIQALKEGRKSQTRRICKPQPYSVGDHVSTRSHGKLMIRRPGDEAWHEIDPPLGPVGRRLWVRETWQLGSRARSAIRYKADGGFGPYVGKWKSPIFMPKEFSRFLLEVTEIRVQRIQEILEEDAKAEGIENDAPHSAVWFNYQEKCWDARLSARDSFKTLWNSLHGPDAWDRNDWVFAYTFKQVEK